MDNEGGMDLPAGGDPNAGAAGLLFDGGDLGAGQDENVDQYFDDGGETFLPADHVSTLSIHVATKSSDCMGGFCFMNELLIQIVTAMLFYSPLWPVCKTLSPSN